MKVADCLRPFVVVCKEDGASGRSVTRNAEIGPGDGADLLPWIAGAAEGAAALATEEVFGFLDDYVAAYVGDGVGQGDLLGAGLDAVLGEAALLDAAVAGEGAETIFLENLAGGVVVEELDLGDGGRTDEVGILVELGADFHAAAATDAVGERVVGLLLLGEDARARA
jgi:hypothetical protein